MISENIPYAITPQNFKFKTEDSGFRVGAAVVNFSYDEQVEDPEIGTLVFLLKAWNPERTIGTRVLSSSKCDPSMFT